MYKISDMVIYGSEGVCEIVDIEEKDILGEQRKYYVLKPVKKDSSTYYAPMDNEKALAKMRKLLSKEEIDELIDSMPDEQPNWITNSLERREKYKLIISKGNHTELIRVIKAIFTEKKEREANGKRLASSDERFLKEADTANSGMC